MGIPFNKTLGPANLVTAPPFNLTDVTLFGFPLMADPVHLQCLVENSLNVVPKDVAFFEPAAPLVLMLVANYGEGFDQSLQLGAVSLTEVGFAIPVFWYRYEKGKVKLLGSAFFFPYIFVEDEWAMVTGRELYGWPKQLGWFSPSISSWIKDPNLWKSMASFSTHLNEEMWYGGTPKPGVLFEIQETPATSLLQWPGVNNPANPINFFPRIARNFATLANDSFRCLYWWGKLGVLSHPLAVLSALFSNLEEMKNLVVNLITLKQFRDAEKTSEVCYQALVNSPMKVLGVKEAGFLGCPEKEPSAGYRIRFNINASQPLVSSLGLDVAAWERTGKEYVPGPQISRGPADHTRLTRLPTPGPDQYSRYMPEPSTAIIQPLFPFWARVNMKYGGGQVLTWRTRNSPWVIPDEQPARSEEQDPSPGEPEPPVEPSPPYVEPPERKRGNPYNLTLGVTLKEVPGPYYFADVVSRVMPLRADYAALKRFCDGYLNFAPGNRFEPWGRHVYLTFSNFSRMVSLTENLGDWMRHEVSFSFPVKWYRDGKWVSTAMVSPYSFSNSEISTLSSREILGLPVFLANFVIPPAVWSDAGGQETQPLLQMWTSMFPALSLSQKSERRVLLELLQRNGEGKQPARRPSRKNVTAKRADLMAWGLELLLGRKELRSVTLKQFRNASKVDSASYQAIVCICGSMGRLGSLERIRDPLEVRIHQSPNFPIVEQLGLEAERIQLERPSQSGHVWQGSLIDILKPIDPFWLRGSWRSENNLNLAWRAAGDPRWHLADPDDPCFEEPMRLEVGADIVEFIRQEANRKRDLEQALEEWQKSSGTAPVSPEELVQSLLACDDPQEVVKSILDEGWGSPEAA